jgi:acylphosphatase
MRSVRVVVRGRVQGVGFRFFTQREASSRKVRGWVRNCADGSVEAQLEGEAAAIDALLARLRRGPAHAAVSALELRESRSESEGEAAGESAGERAPDAFEVR